MANITENRISTTITPADETILNTATATITPVLESYTIALEEVERASLFSLDEANKVFAEEAYQEADTNGSILPVPLQNLIPEMRKDLTLFNQLDQMESGLNQWVTRIKDTKRLAAHESYKVALTIYTMYEALAKAGVPGAQASYDRLKERFLNRGAGAPPADNP